MLRVQILEAVPHTASYQVGDGHILRLAAEGPAITGLVQGTGIDLLAARTLEGHASTERLVEGEEAAVVEGRDRKAGILDPDGEIVEVVAEAVDSFWNAYFVYCRQSQWVVVVIDRLDRYYDSLASGGLASEDSRMGDSVPWADLVEGDVERTPS